MVRASEFYAGRRHKYSLKLIEVESILRGVKCALTDFSSFPRGRGGKKRTRGAESWQSNLG